MRSRTVTRRATRKAKWIADPRFASLTAPGRITVTRRDQPGSALPRFVTAAAAFVIAAAVANCAGDGRPSAGLEDPLEPPTPAHFEAPSPRVTVHRGVYPPASTGYGGIEDYAYRRGFAVGWLDGAGRLGPDPFRHASDFDDFTEAAFSDGYEDGHEDGLAAPPVARAGASGFAAPPPRSLAPAP